MKVDFNNLRKQAVFSYDKLCQKLNNARIKSGGDWVEEYGTLNTGDIVIDPETIQKDMEDLRALIGSIAMVYEPGNEDFKDVYSEVFPEDNPEIMQIFNEEKD